MEIIIYSHTGDLVYSVNYPYTFSVTLSDKKIRDLKEGIYFLYVYSGKKVFGPFKVMKLNSP
ncbi:MAG: hypothetical protein ABDH49_01320 [Candidatus Hydrothermales bacterium]